MVTQQHTALEDKETQRDLFAYIAVFGPCLQYMPVSDFYFHVACLCGWEVCSFRVGVGLCALKYLLKHK